MMLVASPVVVALLDAGADPAMVSGPSPNSAPVFEIALRLVMAWFASSAGARTAAKIESFEELSAHEIAVPHVNLIIRHLKRRRALVDAHCSLLPPLRAIISGYDTHFDPHPPIEALLRAEDQAAALATNKLYASALA
jgi:hypothetical protein